MARWAAGVAHWAEALVRTLVARWSFPAPSFPWVQVEAFCPGFLQEAAERAETDFQPGTLLWCLCALLWNVFVNTRWDVGEARLVAFEITCHFAGFMVNRTGSCPSAFSSLVPTVSLAAH